MSDTFLIVKPGDLRNAAILRVMKAEGRRTGIYWGGLYWTAHENPEGTFTFIASKTENGIEGREANSFSTKLPR